MGWDGIVYHTTDNVVRRVIIEQIFLRMLLGVDTCV